VISADLELDLTKVTKGTSQSAILDASPDLRNAAVPDLRNAANPDLRNAASPDLRNAAVPSLRDDATEDDLAAEVVIDIMMVIRTEEMLEAMAMIARQDTSVITV